VRQLVAAVRAAIGEQLPIMLRFPNGSSRITRQRSPAVPMSSTAPSAISAAGVDIFDASTRRFHEPEFAGSSLNLAGWTQRITEADNDRGSIGLNKDPTRDSKKGMSASWISAGDRPVQPSEFSLWA